MQLEQSEGSCKGRAERGAGAEQGACGIWQRSTRVAKAAPEIQGLWLQLSQNNGEAFSWSLLPSPSTTAGDHSPVTVAEGHRMALVGSGRAGSKLTPIFIS